MFIGRARSTGDSGWSEPHITYASRRARLSMTRKPGRLGGWEGIPRNTTVLPISNCIMDARAVRRQPSDRLPFRAGQPGTVLLTGECQTSNHLSGAAREQPKIKHRPNRFAVLDEIDRLG